VIWLVVGLVWLVAAVVAGIAMGRHLRRIGATYAEPDPDTDWEDAA
jgi:hypothetical protein